MLIKSGKKRLYQRINKTHSSGLFTNIEEAILQSSKAWFNKPESQTRHLILLTDGVVDVSEDIMESAESRERILIEQVTELQQAGIKVHTIALSENADTQLLEKLAFDTNGWNETVLYADQLQKVFFKIFKQAVPKDTVPIQGNSFKVDSSIDEFSVLIFKKEGAQVTQLITPDNTEIDVDNQVENVSWLSDKNYDLVTIKKPMTGKWVIDAEMDPDNQVMIVTDLKFKVEEIPNHISDQESLDLSAYFSDKHELISREEFLNLIEISIELINETGEKKEWKMQSVTEKPGLFRKIVESGLGRGKHTIKIKVDGKTFQREYIQAIEVVESLIRVDVEINKKSRIVTIKLIPDKNLINSEKMSIQASITQSGQVVKNRELINKNGTWELVVEETLEGERKIINFSITARSLKGNALSPNLKPIVVDDSLFFKSKVESQTDEVEQNLEKTKDDDSDEDEDDIDENNDINWIKTSAIVVVVNIIVIAIGFFLFNFLKKRAANSQAQLLARLE